MIKRILCNASPLILLSKIGRLHLLSDLFDEVFVPESAWNEAVYKPDSMTNDLMQFKLSTKLTVFKVENSVAVSAMIGRLHIGEVEVIVGADELGIRNVVLDDGYARSKAKQMGLSVTGTLGILIAGRDAGNVSDLNSDIDSLIENGFRISENILSQVRSNTK